MRRPLYALFVLFALFSLLFTSCLNKKTPTPTPSPTNTPAKPQTLPTNTPGPTPTPPPPDQVVPVGMVSPVIVQHSPQTGEELPLDGAVELVFDRAMDKASVEKAFVVSPAVDGRFEWTDARTVRFVPASLKRGASYHVYLGQEASDTEGAILAGAYRFRFQTVGYLEVAQVIPAPDSVDVEADSIITVMFNRPVVPLTSLKQMEGLPNPVTFDPPIEGTGEWLNTSMYLFTPDQPLAGGTQYNARVAAGLADTIGGVLDLDYAWSFTTEPPKIVWTTPQTDGDRAVPPNTSIRIQFNQPIDPVSAQTAFSMIGGTWGAAVEGKFEVLTDTLVFTPSEMLEFDKPYTVRVEAGVLSALSATRSDIVSVGMRDPYEWIFVTSPLPRIIETRPAHLERNALPYTAFEIVFNTTIDPATVMPNLQMTPPLSPTQVYTYFSDWDYTFVLGFGAQPSTEYEVNIGPDIADPFGNTTGQRKTVKFRTAPLDPSAELHVPGNISTLNANDPARLFVSHINVSKLDFELYSLTKDEFFALQREWYDFRPATRIRQWRETVESPLNEREYARVELVEDGGTLQPGFYLIELDSPDFKNRDWRQRHLLVVSTINLTLKSSAEELLVWATELDTGRPVANLSLSLFDWYSGTQLGATASTDADGLARLPIADANRYYNISVLSESPFVVASAYWNQGISSWEFGFGGGQGYQPYRIFIDTDRPIYRAGQTVHFRGLVRSEDDVEYWLPDLSQVQVNIYDAAYNVVFEQALPLDEFGAFSGELALPEGASLGPYSINVQASGSSWAYSFQVAAYRPPEFEVIVEPAQTEILLGQSNAAAVQVRYFFGGPVQDVPVSWNVLGETYTFDSPQFGRYTFSDTDDPWICRWCWWRPVSPPQVLLSGSGRTDAEGNLLIELPAEWADSSSKPITYSLKLVVEATVSGNDGQVISGRSEVVAHRSDIYIGLAAQQYVGQAEKEMTVDLLTVDWQANRQPNKALKLSVYRREWKNVFKENETGGGNWTWTTEDIFITEADVTTGANGEATFTFTPPVGGSYHVIAESRTSPVARSSMFLWVSGKDYISWRRTNDDRIDLIADKGTYKPGEVAEILIPSPFQGEHWAWITVERGGVLQQEVIKLTNNSTVYRLPITDRHVPNIYVSAVIIKGKDADNKIANYKVGYTALTVEPEMQTLHVELVPAVEQALPGETVTFDVRATDYTGEPVAASFSLDLVDKAVLSLMPRESNAILNAFYGRRALQVNTASGLSISLSRLLIEQEEQYDQTLAHEYKAAGARDDAVKVVEREVAIQATASPAPAMAMQKEEAAAAPAGVDLREEFADTAFWQADFVTGADGRGQVKIKLPDNLTTWVFRGVGATGETVVGEATVDLLVTKPLLIRPVTPRFFVVEDEAYLAASVSNNTDQELSVEVALSSTGLTLHDPATQTIVVPARGEVQVTWHVTVQDVPSVEVIFSAISGEYNDAARPRLTTGPNGTLMVFRYTAPDIVGTGGQLVTSGARTEVIALPPRYDDRRGEVMIQLDPSLAAGMRDGLDYLEHFEYECTEQTVSRFLPNVLTYRALQELGIVDPELESKLPALVKEGLDKLYLQQRDDGGWGWWKEASASNPHITAYVVFAMDKAQKAGFAVDQNVINRGLDYLNGQLSPVRRIASYREANLQSFILYVMAEAGRGGQVSEYTGGLFDNREKLSHFGKAFLALTLDLIGERDGRVDTLLSDLNNAAILSATGAHWEEQNYDWWAMNTDTRSTGVILDALARLDPENELIPNVVRWLMVARKDGIWETTQETAWALIAFTDWMRVTGELKGNYEYAASLNGETLAEGTVNADNVGESIKIKVAIADLIADQGNYLQIGRGEGDGRLYYTAHLRVYLPVEEIDPVNRGIIVYREYTDAACEPTRENPCPEVQEIKVGDVVRVKLTIIAPNDLYYVVVEDPLPAGGEAIDTTLATTSLLDQDPSLRRQNKGSMWYDWYWWWWNWYSRSEMRDEKVVLFADYLAKGTYEYTYTFRATLPGEYRVIPTVASEMYFPEVFGRSDGRLLTIARGKE